MAIGYGFRSGQSWLFDRHEFLRQPVVRTGPVESGNGGNSASRHIRNHGKIAIRVLSVFSREIMGKKKKTKY